MPWQAAQLTDIKWVGGEIFVGIEIQYVAHNEIQSKKEDIN